MGRECPRCGEALMGAVNRCWKCGLDLRAETHPGTTTASVVAAEPLIVAEVVEFQPAEAAMVSTPSPTAADPAMQIGPDGYVVRRGSPFVAGALLLPPRQVPAFASAAVKSQPPTLQQSYASNGGAIAALVLGLFGIVLAPLRFEGAIVGAVGLVMGIWGLYSRRRGWALVGLILCCLAIGIGMYTGVFWLFQTINNANPWEY